MPGAPRAAVGGIVYHVLNRGNARLPVFESPDEYALFLSILTKARVEIDPQVEIMESIVTEKYVRCFP